MRNISGVGFMNFPRIALIGGSLLVAGPAFAQSHPGGYVEEIIVSERYREPVYEVRAPAVYAPPRERRHVPETPTVFSRHDRDRMYYNPYTREYPPADPRRWSPYNRTLTPQSPRRLAPQNPTVQRRAIPDEYRRQTVIYDGPGKPGEIIIDTRTRHLYLINADGTALRYGIGVGRDGFQWTGTHKITNKREWPDWYPPAEMRARRPDLPKMMKGGPDNPLGARALYLGSTLYRIHGSNEPWTIGQAVSSGCFRMTNEDVQDLYERVAVGTTVRVL